MEKDGLKEDSGKSNSLKNHVGPSAFRNIKVCFVGDYGVGKTSIIHRYIKGNFLQDHHTTLGGESMAMEVQYLGQRFSFCIWDLAGSESYKSIVPMYFRGAKAFIVVYDCTKKETFNSAEVWNNLIRSKIPVNVDDFAFILVGNKTDKRNVMDSVSPADGVILADSLGYCFHETSALTGEGIINLFDKLCRELLNIQRRNQSHENRERPNSEREPINRPISLTEPPPPRNTHTRKCC